MRIRAIRIVNFRSLSNLTWQLPRDRKAAGWHVVIGDNGSGKSSFLKAVALALIGPEETKALREDWHTWIRQGATVASVLVWFGYSRKIDIWAFSGRKQVKSFLKIGIRLQSMEGEVRVVALPMRVSPKRHIWSGKSGWFSAAFGPFRRFTGGDMDFEKLFFSKPRLARHLSVFGENVALTECLEWLKQLHIDALEAGSGSQEEGFLKSIIKFVNKSELLPHGVTIDSVTSKEVRFIDGSGFKIPVENLSDGFRSILSLTFELIRQLANSFGYERIFSVEDPTKISFSSIVLVDEIDAHLHPSWQQRVGVWFREHFPETQFIVTTHSPLVCQAANVGTVFRLPTPGSDEEGRMLEGAELERLIYGNVLEAYSTEMFGEGISRSEAAQQMLLRLAELNQKEKSESLSEEEKVDRDKLRAVFPTQSEVSKKTEKKG